jgi:tRNA uridine 5-carbamoylmethylation protein Kti12
VVGVDKFFDAKKTSYDHILYEKVIEKFHIKALAEMKEYINNVENVVIDMTNVSKEMRRKKICQFPVTKYHKKAVVFLTGRELLLTQAKKRKDKTIPPEVITNQIMNFELPSYDEFDEILYIF